MTARFDSPKVVFLAVSLGSGSLGGARGIVIVLGRVLQLIITAGADDDHLFVRVWVDASIAGEAWTSRNRSLEVGLGRRLAPAETTEAIGLVVEFGRVAS